MPISGRLSLLNEIEETTALSNSEDALKQEFLQPDRPRDRFVNDAQDLDDALTRFRSQFKGEEGAAKEAELRKALIAYAPERLKAEFGFPESERAAFGLLNHIEGIVVSENQTNEILAVAHAVIDQIAEKEIEKVLAARKDEGPKPRGPRTP